MLATEKKSIRVLLFDEEVVVRAGLRKLIESWPHLKVIGEAGNPGDAVASTPQEKPDIILYNHHFSRGPNSLDLLPHLLSAYSGGHIIVLTAIGDSDAHLRAVSLGARGLVLKERGAEELREAILNVFAGEVWLDRKLTADMITRIVQPKKAELEDREFANIAQLTERERSITTLVGEGLKNKGIAKRLFVSESTVRHHLTSIFKKLDISSRFELIILVQRQQSIKNGTLG
jgi:two-component system nitrate/nitrite response regulator NarL